MKVQELIDALSQQDPEATVRFTYNYGDRCNSIVAHEVRKVDIGQVKHSDYIRDFVSFEPDSDEESWNAADDDEIKDAVLLS